MSTDEPILSSLLELAEHADDTLLLLDREWRFTYLNRQTLAVARLPAEDLLGRVIWDVYPSLLGTPLEAAFRRTMAQREASRFEHPSVLSGAWYDVRVYPVGLGIAVQGRDVSERRRAEEALRDSNERFRALFDSTSDAVVVHDDGVVLEVNRSCCELFGYEAEELLGRDGIALVFSPEARDRIRRLAAEGYEGAYEAALRRRDGSTLLAEVRGRTIEYGGRRVRVVSNRDVTEQRRAADELRESEHRFRQLAEAVDGVFFMVDLATERLLYVSPAYERLWGRSVRGLLEGTESFLDGVHPDDRARVRAALRPVGDRGADIEYRVVRPDGSEIWVRDRTFPIRDAAGRVYRLGGITEDVTERRRAAEAMRANNEQLERRVAERTAELEARTRALRESEERYARAAEAGRVGVWEFDVVSGELYLAPDLKRLLGYEPGELPNRLDAWCALVHPDDKRLAIEATEDHLAGRAPVYEVEVRRRHRDGGYRWFLAQGRAVRDDHGAALRLVGSDTEITERRRADERLRESERHHRELAEHNRRLARELAHRVGNNLSALMALVPMISARAADVGAFAAAVEARLRGMAHAHRVLTQSDWRPVGLRALVDTTLRAMGYAARHNCPEFVDGPEGVDVGARQVLPLTLVLAELYTNSCKYGAHSAPGGGQLRVAWQVRRSAAEADDGTSVARTILLRWEERGGPRVAGPICPSLGTRLVHGFVERELGGRCELRFPPDGADHVIEFPAGGPDAE